MSKRAFSRHEHQIKEKKVLLNLIWSILIKIIKSNRLNISGEELNIRKYYGCWVLEYTPNRSFAVPNGHNAQGFMKGFIFLNALYRPGTEKVSDFCFPLILGGSCGNVAVVVW